VNTYISFPAISESGYNNNKKCNDKIAETIKLKFNSITISDNNKYVFDDDLFFNGNYHLDSSGRTIRTDNLIKDLRSVLQH